MSGISEFAREEEESLTADLRQKLIEEGSGVLSGQQRVDLGELLLAMRNAIEKMSVHNTHRGVMTTAGSVIIHLLTENGLLKEALEAAKEALAPKVTLD